MIKLKTGAGSVGLPSRGRIVGSTERHQLYAPAGNCQAGLITLGASVKTLLHLIDWRLPPPTVELRSSCWRKEYDQIKQKGAKQFFLGAGFAKRELVTKHITDCVRYPDYFLNEHHRAAFDFVLACLSSWLFTPAGPQGAATRSGQVHAELKQQTGLAAFHHGITGETRGHARWQGPICPSRARLVHRPHGPS